MSVSIFDENTPQDGLEFVPYNESPVKAVQVVTASLSGTMDTREIDSFRQGVELTTAAHRYKGLGAKIWAGNIKGYTIIRTLGQALSFTEYKNDKRFNDLLVRFNPVSYIQLGENYPYPLIFNEGPQQNKETSIQPFTIPFRNGRDSNESQDVAHQVRGAVEDGNQNNLQLNGYTDKITQFVPFYNAAEEHSPFLDEGGYTIGATEEGGVQIQGYINSAEINLVPFDDRSTHKLIDQLHLPDPTYSIEITGYHTVVTTSQQEYTGSILLTSSSNDPIVHFPFSGSLLAAVMNHDSGTQIGTLNYVPATINGVDTLAAHIGTGFSTNGIYVPPLNIPTYRQLTESCTFSTFVYLMPSASWGNTNRTFFTIRGTSESGESNNLFGLTYNATNTLIYYNHEYNSGSEYLVSTSLPLTTNQWIHLAVVRDYEASPTASLFYYQDGTLLTSVPITTFPTTGTLGIQDLRIGNAAIENLTDSRLTGSLHSFKMFQRALTSEEISYEAMLPGITDIIEVVTSSIVTVMSSTQVPETILVENNEFRRVLQDPNFQLDLDEDVRQNYYQKSSAAGRDVYGPTQGQTGTDSITFGGWLRGC